MERKQIIEVFERIEAEAGGINKADPQETLDKTCLALSLDRQQVRQVMIDHWTSQGAG